MNAPSGDTFQRVSDVGQSSARAVARLARGDCRYWLELCSAGRLESHLGAPTPTFRRKGAVRPGGIATTGLLPEDGVAKALAALQRFRVLCDTMRISNIRSIATAAVRDAANGPQFVSLAESAIGCKIELLSGSQEARLSALGVVSSIHRADGIVGDLGGGSLELTEIKGRRRSLGTDFADRRTFADGSFGALPKKAAKIVRETLGRQTAAVLARTHFLRGRRDVALARAAAHAATTVSDERHAQLRDSRHVTLSNLRGSWSASKSRL